MEKELTTFCPASQKEWRQWLRKNHKSFDSVWLVLYKKNTNIPSVGWSDLVDEALCFGWIDGKRLSVDGDRFKQFFCKRKPKSTWSKINKEKVERLIAAQLMTKAGFEAIRIAKENRSWNILDDVENFVIPKDLEAAFKKNLASKAHFLKLSPSVRKIWLSKLAFSKRTETRATHIAAIVKLKPVTSDL